jgi:preprotein translocase subunit YajC
MNMMNLILADSYAQAAAPGAPGAQSTLMSFLPFILVFFVFYFLMIRPQKKKMDEEKNFLSALKKGDEVYTKSGIIGTIYGLTDKVVTLELAQDVRIKILRSQIGGASQTLLQEKEAAK